MKDITHGDCIEVMQSMAAESATAVVTDPPYGLEFMGKEWDHGVPGVPFWAEALRVLRPGGHALVFGGTRTFHRLACALEDAGFEIRDCLMWLYGQGFPKSKNIGGGYGTALKPAWEPIILARKPLVGTVARNCQERGTGALNIDGCRGEDNPGYSYNADRNGTTFHGEQGDRAKQTSEKRGRDRIESVKGRWPANVVLDEEAGAMLDEQAPDKGQTAPLKETGRDRPGHGRFGKMGPPKAAEPKDTPGGASRFFYCAKASKRDRGEGNNHPTVKPVELMRWLVRLVKGPSENLILDPFAGSGTTGVACQLEGVRFMLIEKQREYVDIIEKRLSSPKQPPLLP